MTNPTADAAKLLPCPFPWRGDDGSIKQCVERNHCGCGKNTRPQPAPPAGEPDFNFDVEYLYRHGDRHGIQRALREAYRLGLAARPKVEEADDNAHLKTIDQRDEAEEAISHAYFLIIGHSPEWSNNFGHEEALEEIKDAQSVLRQSLKAAESKLAEREAELAKADAVITVARSFVRAVDANRLADTGSLALKFERFAAAQNLLCDAVKQYDAARQQQKALAEKDKTHG